MSSYHAAVSVVPVVPLYQLMQVEWTGSVLKYASVEEPVYRGPLAKQKGHSYSIVLHWPDSHRTCTYNYTVSSHPATRDELIWMLNQTALDALPKINRYVAECNLGCCKSCLWGNSGNFTRDCCALFFCCMCFMRCFCSDRFLGVGPSELSRQDLDHITTTADTLFARKV